MSTKLFVGNLPFTTAEEQLSELFAEYGQVASTVIPKDRDTGRTRGFAFVEMDSAESADAAMKALNGYTLDGRQMKVDVSQPKPRNAFSGGRY